ncbi:MAG: hypothetical protein ABH874_08185 [Methanobacteriota archaeon]
MKILREIKYMQYETVPILKDIKKLLERKSGDCSFGYNAERGG